MSRKHGVVVLLVGTVVLALGVITTSVAQESDATPEAPQSSESLPGGLVVRLVERAETDAVIDLGASGDSVGDLLAFGNPIFDPSNETQLGTNQGSCVRTVVGQSWECSWTLTLPDGQIAVQGPYLDGGDSVLAIIGGTDSYRAARGQVLLHPRDAEGTEYDLTYEIE
jgi:allene oxide cyclase